MNAREDGTQSVAQHGGGAGWDALEALVRGGKPSAASVPPVSDALSAAPGDTVADGVKSAAVADNFKSAAVAALPEYRRVWFLSLIRQGREAEAAGREALAAHCRERMARELATLTAAPAVATFAVTPRAPRAKDTGSGDAPGAASEEQSEGTGTKTRARGGSGSPLDELAARQSQAARAQLMGLLARHRDRLPRAERAAFEAAAADATPAAVTELRRRLVDRLLRAGRYRRQAARLAAWKPLAPEETPTGPYNDFRALEDVLHRTATVASGSSGGVENGAEWVAEFFDLYETMRATRRLYGQLLPGSKN